MHRPMRAGLADNARRRISGRYSEWRCAAQWRRRCGAMRETVVVAEGSGRISVRDPLEAQAPCSASAHCSSASIRHLWRSRGLPVPVRILAPAHHIASQQISELYPEGGSNCCRRCQRRADIAAFDDRQVLLGEPGGSRNLSLGQPDPGSRTAHLLGKVAGCLRCHGTDAIGQAPSSLPASCDTTQRASTSA
jgi:hypothetical protein